MRAPEEPSGAGSRSTRPCAAARRELGAVALPQSSPAQRRRPACLAESDRLRQGAHRKHGQRWRWAVWHRMDADPVVLPMDGGRAQVPGAARVGTGEHAIGLPDGGAAIVFRPIRENVADALFGHGPAPRRQTAIKSIHGSAGCRLSRPDNGSLPRRRGSPRSSLHEQRQTDTAFRTGNDLT